MVGILSAAKNDPPAGTFILTDNHNNQDICHNMKNIILPFIFVLALWAGLPAQPIQWFRSIGSDQASTVWLTSALDRQENTYSFGYFKGPLDADPGPGELMLDPGVYADFYLQKLDKDGKLLWAREMNVPATTSQEFGAAGQVGLNALGEAYVNYISYSEVNDSIIYHAYVRKYDVDGEMLWERQLQVDNHWRIGHFPVDSAGNCYLVACRERAIDADPGPGVFVLPTSKGLMEPYVIKLNTDGHFAWAKSIGAAHPFDLSAIEGHVRIQDDRLFAQGYFLGTFDFDPGPAAEVRNTQGKLQCFNFSLDTGGHFQRVVPLFTEPKFKQDTIDILGETYVFWDPLIWNNTAAFAVDDSENLYTCGIFKDSLDIDPGLDTFMIRPAGSIDAFLQKLDADGNLEWAYTWGGEGYDDLVSIETDGKGNLYCAGRYSDTLDFNPTPATAVLIPEKGSDMFLMKMTGSGQFLWARSIDLGIGAAFPSASGAIYMAGGFLDTANIETVAGPLQIAPKGDFDTFFLKMTQGSTGDASPPLQAVLLSLYPNPARDEITLALNPEASNTCVELFDTGGRLLLSRQFNRQALAQLDISALVPGVYYVSVRTRQGNWVGKMVKE